MKNKFENLTESEINNHVPCIKCQSIYSINRSAETKIRTKLMDNNYVYLCLEHAMELKQNVLFIDLYF